SRMDVALTYSMFWGVVTALSLGMITRLAYVMFGRADVAAMVCLLALGIGFCDPRIFVYDAAIITPYPTRYGFGSGVLMPLILLMFWSILRDPRTHVWRWALLAYLIVETTFVHARETILTMGAIAVACLLLAARPRRHRQEIVRVGMVLGLITIVLVAYKYVNLSLASQLDTYVAGLTMLSKASARHILDLQGPWLGFFSAPPSSLTTQVTTTA